MRKRKYFNPHEREARDITPGMILSICQILIHTSVKLVTKNNKTYVSDVHILIHTSVKLVTREDHLRGAFRNILIHTSVKLVTHFWLR